MNPIIRTLWRNRFTASLSVLQMTIALAVVLNALSIFNARIERSFRQTGMEETNLLTVKQTWVTEPDENGKVDSSSFIPRQRADVAVLRSIPGVSGVSVTNSLPLAGWSRNGMLSRTPSDKFPKLETALYYADDSLLKTLGAHIQQGRDFLASEVRDMKSSDPISAGPIIVTRELAHTLFGNASALGQTLFVNGSASPSTIVGVLDNLQTPSRSAWGDRFAFNSVVVPARMATDTTYFAIRVRPGELERVKERVANALYEASTARVIEDDGVQSFTDIRSDAYRADRSMAWMMIVISAVFLVITASGVVGLTSFWVRKRQRSIGVRRALGATRRDILVQFLAENTVLACSASLLGAALTIALNEVLMSHFETARIHAIPTFIGMLVLVGISLISSLIPSIRAAKVAPVVAIRDV